MGKNKQLWNVHTPTPSSSNKFVRFESEDEMAELQQDMLELLKGSGVDRTRYDQLAACGSQDCGADPCMEACWFGTRRRRLREISPVYSLIQHSEGPVYEARTLSLNLVSADRTASRCQYRSSEAIATPGVRQAEHAGAGCCRNV